jgi:hypothetical protein
MVDYMTEKFTALRTCAEGAASAHRLNGISQLGDIQMQLLGRNFLTFVHCAQLTATTYEQDGIAGILQGDNMYDSVHIHRPLTLHSPLMR